MELDFRLSSYQAQSAKLTKVITSFHDKLKRIIDKSKHSTTMTSTTLAFTGSTPAMEDTAQLS